jgi:hypothetical protein
MRYTPLLIPALAVAALAGTAAPASAQASPIAVSTTGSCPVNYSEAARAGNVVVCYRVGQPRVTIVVDGSDCPAGYSEYSVVDRFRVCIG